jgi:hypothetical protein
MTTQHTIAAFCTCSYYQEHYQFHRLMLSQVVNANYQESILV